MQLDYYHSPCPAGWQERGETPQIDNTPPAKKKMPRNRRKKFVLILFLVLIVLCAGGLIALRIANPDGWKLSLEQLYQDIPGIESFFEFSEEFEFPFGDSELPQDDFGNFGDGGHSETVGTGAGPITIPRSPLAPNVKMNLTPHPNTSLSFQAIYNKVIPSIVSIYAHNGYSGAEGTGIIMTSNGYVVTNHHIIAGCSDAEVVLADGTLHTAKLVGSDAESDLAVLKIKAVGLTPAEFGISDTLHVGDDVLAIGNPLGSELFGTMTEGIVSAINRDVYVDGYTMTLIQTTAALNSGNSGGALINMAGQVIGITNMKMMSDYNTIEGLGFAIPTVWAKEVVDTLLAEGKITGRPTIGFMCFTVTEEGAAYYGHVGVCIESVTAGSPADKAGVLPGDIIIEANGQTITSLEDLTLVRDEAGIGGVMELTVWRGGEILELSLTLVDQYELD